MRENDPRNASTQIDLPRSTDETYVPRPDPRVGLILDSKYKLLESLGQGGMGSIFRAQRLHIGDEVAVKLLHHDLVREKQALERFRREARAAAMIRHPNVVSIHDFNDGNSLDGVLEQGTFRIAFKGTYDSKSRTLTMMQTKVLSGGGWDLGQDVGKLSADGKRISGTGKDPLGESLGITYQWSFTRK